MHKNFLMKKKSVLIRAAYIYIYIYVCTHTHTHTQMCLCMHSHVRMRLWTNYDANAFCELRLGLHDILHAIVMRISTVKTVLWLAVNLHQLFSNGAAFNTQSRRSLTSNAISRSLSHAIRSANCLAWQWTTALCIKWRSIWKQLMVIYG